MFYLLLASVFAETILPYCGNGCFVDATYANSGCSDFTCLCQNPVFIGAVAVCINQNCTAVEQAQTVQWAEQLCLNSGGTDNAGLVSSAVKSASLSLAGLTATSSTPPTFTSTSNLVSGTTTAAAQTGSLSTTSKSRASNQTITWLILVVAALLAFLCT